MSIKQKKIVIIGGGFAGINLVKQLKGCMAYKVILVDKNNYNFFPPLLYQVATGFLETSNISYPFRKLFSQAGNLRFRMGAFIRVDTEEKAVYLSSGKLSYDYLVFATGTVTNFFGMKNVMQYALPMKTMDDALQMRNTLLERLELATITRDPEERRRLLTIVVAGGGSTGVEIPGMMAEQKKTLIQNEYPELVGTQGSIVLVNGAGELLSPMSKKSQEYTYASLANLGVEIVLHTRVKDFDGEKVLLSGVEDRLIEARTLIWATGVTAQVHEGIPAEAYGPGKRLLVDEYQKVLKVDGVYAIGDTCLQQHEEAYPEGHPQLAQVAIQQGENLAKNFKRLHKNKEMEPFAYVDKGTMAIIGRNKAVAELAKPKLFFKGFIAWFMWLFVHLMSLTNHRNRIKTLYNWTVAYFTKDQSLRLIIRPLIKNNLLYQMPDPAEKEDARTADEP